MRLLRIALVITAASLALTSANPTIARRHSRHHKHRSYKKTRNNSASRYWDTVSEKRRTRLRKLRRHEKVTLDDYVLTQPPPETPVTKSPRPPSHYTLPVVADFLRLAKDVYDFEPERASETEFKRAYATAAKAAGITKEQAVRVYAFECGGNGTYDEEAGFEVLSPQAHAISTALGYNQLLIASTVGLVAKNGDRIIATLRQKALADPSRKDLLERKISSLKRMVEDSREVPDDWSAQIRFSHTREGKGVQALLLDIDIGPQLQVDNMLVSLHFAQERGITRELTAAEVELMNLTGEENGLDMILMPQEMREKVPTANFFMHNGYRFNIIARRNDTVAALITAMDHVMDRESRLPGAKALSEAFDH